MSVRNVIMVFTPTGNEDPTAEIMKELQDGTIPDDERKSYEWLQSCLPNPGMLLQPLTKNMAGWVQRVEFWRVLDVSAVQRNPAYPDWTTYIILGPA